jgi:hypothetical protein
VENVFYPTFLTLWGFPARVGLAAFTRQSVTSDSVLSESQTVFGTWRSCMTGCSWLIMSSLQEECKSDHSKLWEEVVRGGN